LATDDALSAFNKFGENYLAPAAPGRQAHLTYNERPVIFIFPKGRHTDWNRVRATTNKCTSFVAPRVSSQPWIPG